MFFVKIDVSAPYVKSSWNRWLQIYEFCIEVVSILFGQSIPIPTFACVKYVRFVVLFAFVYVRFASNIWFVVSFALKNLY